MSKPDPHTWARDAVRTSLRRAVQRQIEDMERGARAHLVVPSMEFEARLVLSEADALRRRAKRAGLLPARKKSP